MKQKKFYEIPFYSNYRITTDGDIISTCTKSEIVPEKHNDIYYVLIDGKLIEIGYLVLLTFVGKMPGEILYIKGNNFYDSRSVCYNINIERIDDDHVSINSILFTRMKKYSRYFISRDGVVYSEYYNKLLRKSFNHNDYPTVSLVDYTGKRSPRKVHRLVYETYIGELIDGLIIDHKNCKKWCSSDWNLEQIDQQENVDRSYKTGANPTGAWSNDQFHYICKLLQENINSREILKRMNLPYADYRKITMLIHNILTKKYYTKISSQYKLDNYPSAINKKDVKLSIDDVMDIKKHLYLRDTTISELACQYNCSSSTIRKIRDNKTWKNIRYEFNE